MNITQKVESILKHSKAARNSDTELLIIYLQKSGMKLSQYQIDKFRELPSMETIRRVRQKIQEQGKYRADHAVEEARYDKYKKVRSEISYSSPEELLAKQGYEIIDG